MKKRKDQQRYTCPNCKQSMLVDAYALGLHMRRCKPPPKRAPRKRSP